MLKYWSWKIYCVHRVAPSFYPNRVDALFNWKYHFPHCHPLCIVYSICILYMPKQNFQLNFNSTSYLSPFHTIILGVNRKHIATVVGTYMDIIQFCYSYIYIYILYILRFDLLHVDILYTSRPVVSFAIPPSGSRVYIDKIHKFISLCFVIEFLILYYCVTSGGRLMLGIIYNKTNGTWSESNKQSTVLSGEICNNINKERLSECFVWTCFVFQINIRSWYGCLMAAEYVLNILWTPKTYRDIY